MDVLWRKIILKKKQRESKRKEEENTKRCEASYTQIGSEVNLHKNYSFRQNGYKVYIFWCSLKQICYLKEKLMVILMERKQKYKDLFWGQIQKYVLFTVKIPW